MTSLQRQTGTGLGSSSRTLDRNESEKKCKINIYGYYNIEGICLSVRWLYTRVIRINFPTRASVYYILYLYRLAGVIICFEGQNWDESKSTPSFFLTLSLPYPFPEFIVCIYIHLPIYTQLIIIIDLYSALDFFFVHNHFVRLP